MIIDPKWPKGLTIDPHDRRPFYMVWWAINPEGQVLFFREWPTDPFHQYTSYENRWEDYGNHIKETERILIPGGSAAVKWRIMDPNFGIQQKGVQGESLKQFMSRRFSLYFRTDVDDSIARGHAAIRRYLSYDKNKPITAFNKPRLLVSKNCWNMLWAFQNYIWKKRGDNGGIISEVPGEDGKDMMDTIRYTLAVDPSFGVDARMTPRYPKAYKGVGAR